MWSYRKLHKILLLDFLVQHLKPLLLRLLLQLKPLLRLLTTSPATTTTTKAAPATTTTTKAVETSEYTVTDIRSIMAQKLNDHRAEIKKKLTDLGTG